MVKRNAIATKLTKVCTQTQKWAFDVAVEQEGGARWSGDRNNIEDGERIKNKCRFSLSITIKAAGARERWRGLVVNPFKHQHGEGAIIILIFLITSYKEVPPPI